jgi:hypothetical protein
MDGESSIDVVITATGIFSSSGDAEIEWLDEVYTQITYDSKSGDKSFRLRDCVLTGARYGREITGG